MTGNYKVGDKIQMHLTGFGEFLATVQRITKDGIMFMFDECAALMVMNSNCTGIDGYEDSELKRWVDTTLKNAFPEEFKKDMYDLGIPSIGMMSEDRKIVVESRDELTRVKKVRLESIFNFFEDDSDEFLAPMKDNNNVRSNFKGMRVEQWLRNTSLEFPGCFACMDVTGHIAHAEANACFGVRPVFWMPYHEGCPFCETESTSV